MDVKHAQWLAMVILTAVLLVAGFTDWRSGRIPNWLTLPAMLGGLVFWLIVGAIMNDELSHWYMAKQSGFALACALVPMAVLYAAGGLGGGDVKLMGVVGALSADWRCVLATAMYGFIVAGLMAIALMVRRRIVLRTLRRIFAAGLQAAAGVKPDIPNDAPPVPFGVALCVAGIVAGAEFMCGLNLPWTGIGP